MALAYSPLFFSARQSVKAALSLLGPAGPNRRVVFDTLALRAFVIDF